MVKYDINYTQVPVGGMYDKHLAHYGRMKKLLEAHQTKAALTAFRRKTMDDQNRLNYQQEYDRIRGLLSHNLTGLGQRSIERMRERRDELENLGAQAINKIQ